MSQAEVRPLPPSSLARMMVEGPAGVIETDVNDPGGEHFFHGRLNLLADILTRFFRRPATEE